MIGIRHKAAQNVKRFISMILAITIVSTIMPAIPVAHAAGDTTEMIVNNAEVSYNRAYTKAYAEFNALNKKATPVNLVLLVDKGITGSSSYPKIKSIIENDLTNADSVTAGKFAFNAGSRVEIIQYTVNVTTSAQTISSDSESLTWNVNTFKPTYGTGNSDEIAALEQAITAVRNAKENDNPTAVLWVLGNKFNRANTDIEDKIKALTSELGDEDAFMTWQYADAPTELLSTYATKDPNGQASAYAAENGFQSGLLDTLKKITSDSLKDRLDLTYSNEYTPEQENKVGNYIVDAQGSTFVTASKSEDTTQHTTTAAITVEAGAPSCKDHTFKIGVNLKDNFDPQSLLPEQGPYAVTWNTGFWDLETQTQTYKLNSVNAQIPSFTLTYDIDESQKNEFGIDDVSKQYRQNTKIYLPKPANIDSMYQEGKAFSGWVDQATNASYSPGDFFDVNKDTTLVPAWGKIVVEKYIGVIQDAGNYSNVIAEDVRERLENTTVSGFLNKTTSITFEDTMPSFVRLPEENNQYAVKITDSEYEDVVYATNIGENGSVVILGFKLVAGSTSGNEKYEAFIYAKDGAVASSGFKDMFYNDYYGTSDSKPDLYPILEKITFNGKVNTSGVTDMSGLFKNLTTLESVDVENLDTTKVTNMSDMFRNVGIDPDAAPIDGEQFLDGFVTSTVTNISGMFASDDSSDGVNIENINLSSWDTSNVTDMSLLFKNYEYTVDGLEELDVSEVNNFSEMFFGTLGITDQGTLNLSEWNIFGKTELISDRSFEFSNVEHHSYNFKCNVTLGEMFQEANIDYNIKLATSEQFSNANPTYVHLDEMFRDAVFKDDAAFDLPWNKIKPSYYEYGYWDNPGIGVNTQYSLLAFAKGAKNIDQTSAQNMITKINVEGVKWLDLCSIFEECTGITSIDMSHWNLTCADMGYSFGTDDTSWSETELTHVYLPIAQRFGFINNLFTNRKGLETITYPKEAIAGRGISSNGSYVFYGCSALKTDLDFSGWNWRLLQSMNYMFTYVSSVETIKLPLPENLADDCWVNMMFYGCTNLKGKINLSNGTNVNTYTSGSDEYDRGVFEGCKNLEEVDLSGWDLSVVSLWNMFKGCTKLKKVDLSDWKKLYNLKHMQNAFSGCESLTEVNFGDAWDSTIEGEYNKDINATSMANMFNGCESLTSIDMTGFSVEDVSSFNSMFSGCTSLKSITLDEWVTNFGQSFNTNNMFSGVSDANLKTNVPQFRDAWSTDENGTIDFTGTTETTQLALEGLEEDALGDPVPEEQPSNGDVSNTEPPAGDQAEPGTEPTQPPVTDEEEQLTVTPPATGNPDAPEDTPPTSTDPDKAEGETEGTPPAETEPDKTEDSSENQGETDSSSTSTAPTEPEDDTVEPEEAPEQTIQDGQGSAEPEVTPNSNPVSAFSANIRNAGAVSNRQDRLPVYGMTIQNMSDLTRSAVLYGVTPDTLLAPQTRMLLGGSEGLYTNPAATEVGTKVDYIVLVRYEGDAGGLSGKVEFTDKLPNGLSFVKENGNFVYRVGEVDGYTDAAYQDTANVSVTIDESTGTLTGTCDNLLAGNYIAITFTCAIEKAGEMIKVGDEEYYIWDNTATGTDGKTSDSSATIRLWYTLPEEGVDPEEPDLAEHAVTYVYRGEIPEGITVPPTAWYQAGETVTVPEIGPYEGYTHAENWVTDSKNDALKKISAESGTTFKMPDEDIVLTLDWTKDKLANQYITINYEYDGDVPDEATSLPQSMTVAVGESVNIFTVEDEAPYGYELSYNFNNSKNWEFEIFGITYQTQYNSTYQKYGLTVNSKFYPIADETTNQLDTSVLFDIIKDHSSYNGSVEATHTLTLKAQFSLLTGTIKFDDNTEEYVSGYTYPMNNLTIKDTGKLLNENKFVRTGYTFAGWSLKPGENQPIVRVDQAPIGDILKLGDTVTLYAQWVFTASSLQLAPLTVYGENAAMDYKLADQKYIYSDGGEESIIPSSTVVTLISDRPTGSPNRKAAIQSFLNPRVFQGGYSYEYLHQYTSNSSYWYKLNEFGDVPVTYLFAVKDGVTVQGGYDEDDIYYNDKNVKLLDSSLRVRYVNDLESIISSSVYVSSDSSKQTIERESRFGAILPENTELYVNDYSDWSTSNKSSNIRLLKDALLSSNKDNWGKGGSNSETIDSFISAAEAEGVTINSERNEFYYIDLIDINLGNAWVTSTEGVKVYWPYPTTIGESNKNTIQLIRFTGLNREYDMGDEGSLQDQLANCTVETVEIDEHTKNGFWFTFDGDGAAIYAITWGDIPDVTVNFDDQIPGGDDGYYETFTLDRVVDETDLSKTRKLVDTDEYKDVKTPVYENHIFKGWFTKPNGQGDSVNSISIGLNTPVESEITLYAYWIPDVNFTVHFEPNNGDKIESQSVKMSAYLQWVNDGEKMDKFPFRAVTGNWTNDDKLLAGWALDAHEIFEEVLSQMSTEHPKYEEVEELVAQTQSALMRYEYLTEDKDVSQDAVKFTMDAVLSIQDDYGVNLSEITIYAMWLEDTTYTIHFDTHCGVEIPSQSVKFSEIVLDEDGYVAGLKDGKKYKEVSAPAIEGYTADSWYIDGIEVYGELLDLLYQVPEEDRDGNWNYLVGQIIYILDNYQTFPQEISDDGGLTHNELIDALYNMYSVDQFVTAYGLHYNNITVHLSWGDNVKLYNLTYHSNDGTGKTYNRTLLGGSTVTVEGDDLFTRDGYVLTGWNTKDDGSGIAYEFGSEFKMPANQDADLYAVWEESKYTLTYDSNDGTGRTDKVELLKNGATVTVKDGSLFPRSGYKLTGWNTKADGSGTAYAFGSEFTMPTNQDATLYAVWAKTYTVSYDLQGGIGADGVNYDPQTYPEGTIITVLPAPHRDGYTFVGWSTVNGSGISYQSSDTFELTQDITLFAQWKKNSDGGAHHPEVDPDDEKPEEIIKEDVPLAETPWLNTDDHYAYIIGYAEDGTVRPQANITRAEVATIFFRLLTDEARDQFWMTTNDFPDVQPTDWYNNAVSTMVNAGIIQGYEDGTFRPNANITRAEFAAIASRFMSSGYDVEEDLFTDIANHWARDNINDAAMTQWIHGYPDGTFLPNKAITRAEAVTLVNNVLQRKPHKDHMLDDMIVWPDNPEGAWYYEAIQEATNSHDYDLFEDAAYEMWTALLENRDWAALEKDWLNAHRAGGEVM